MTMAHWTVTVGMNDIATEDNFKDAVKAMVEGIKKMMKDTGTSWQVLESACWIDSSYADQKPIMFPVIRDIAADAGWTVEGVWVDD